MLQSGICGPVWGVAEVDHAGWPVHGVAAAGAGIAWAPAFEAAFAFGAVRGAVAALFGCAAACPPLVVAAGACCHGLPAGL